MFPLCGRIDTCSVPHATQRNGRHGTARHGTTPHAARRTAPRRVARCRHTFAHCAIRRRPYAYRRPRVYMYAGHIDTQFDTHRLHNRPISRRGSGLGAARRRGELPSTIRFNRLRSRAGTIRSLAVSFFNREIRIFFYDFASYNINSCRNFYLHILLLFL